MQWCGRTCIAPPKDAGEPAEFRDERGIPRCALASAFRQRGHLDPSAIQSPPLKPKAPPSHLIPRTTGSSIGNVYTLGDIAPPPALAEQQYQCCNNRFRKNGQMRILVQQQTSMADSIRRPKHNDDHDDSDDED